MWLLLDMGIFLHFLGGGSDRDFSSSPTSPFSMSNFNDEEKRKDAAEHRE